MPRPFTTSAFFGLGLMLHMSLSAAPEARTLPLAVAPDRPAGFTPMLFLQTGIAFSNAIPESRFKTNQILLNGSGVAAGDVDGDGLCDLYFGRLHGTNALYRNLGNWRFEDITASAGVGCARLDTTGVSFADLDGDQDLDLVVNTIGHGTHVFLNDGRARFRELTVTAPLNAAHGGMSMALGDVDGDGFLDLYIANYRTLALMDMPNTRFWLIKTNGQQVVSTVNGRSVKEPDLANRFLVTPRGGIEELGEQDSFYRNAGGTNFVPISFTNGAFADEDGRILASPPFDWGLAVALRDINQDGLPDIYVCNDFDSPDRIWLNQGGGKFRAAPRLALRKMSLFSMGVDFADINRDGFDDIFVVDMLSREHVRRMNFLPDRKPHIPFVGEYDNRPQYPRNALFLNRGDGTYMEIGSLAGLQASEWSWCPAFLDVDLDGWEDVLVTNGHERDARNMDKVEEIRLMRAAGKMKTPEETFNARAIFPRLATANLAFRNNHDLTFQEVGAQWHFDYVGVSHGMALADLDNDGDMDVIVNNLNAAPSVLRNDASAPRVAVRLKGQKPNTAGIGAKIKVLGGPVAQQQEMICAGRYLASDQAQRTFAAGSGTNLLAIEVQWRSGKRSTVTGVKANSLCEIEEPSGPAPGTPVETRAPAEPFFKDVSTLLNHTHHEEPFDDFALQATLPYKLSQPGPGVSWFDVDGDGWDDVIVPSGKGGTLAVLRNDGRGGFSRLNDPPFNRPVTRDQTTVLGWQRAPGQAVLLAGSAAWETSTNETCVTEYDLKSRITVNRLPSGTASTGPLALADIDGDGDLDLFVGGRVIPGRYPLPAASMVFRNAGGRWELDAENSGRCAGLGMVNGAVFSDLNGDAQPDLVLACDWGAVRILKNERGLFRDVTHDLGLAAFKGWWNGVATGDFDNDGRLDIVASNWGRNGPFEPQPAHPLKLYYGDFIGDGSVQMIEAHYESGLKKIVPRHDLDFIAGVLPIARARFPTHDAYGHASVEEILGETAARGQILEANSLETTVFLNRGTNFLARPLPLMAQVSAAFGLCVADYDGDGHQDIFLAQNFFATQPETPRQDAGVGLWLKGDGRGEFMPVPPRESGVYIFGEQRGAAVADYDGDGRLDLLVGQNAHATKLFHNTRARPGWRVRLVGPPANPHAIGATLRLSDGSHSGAACEVQAGSGYWSQNSAVQVMTFDGQPTELQIRWPGGREARVPINSAARDLTLNITNTVQ
jgi:enediyne biosynthesis protein E4